MPGKIKYLLVLGLLLVAASGCWDRWEIDERGMVLGLGLDEARLEQAGNFSGLEGELLIRAQRAFAVTFQFAIPAEIAGEKAGGAEAYWNLTSTSPGAINEIRALAATRSGKKPYFAHVGVLVLGEELAKKGLSPALDEFFRYKGVRRKVPVYVTQGKAQEILNVKPKSQRVNATYLAALSTNADEATRIVPEMTLGDLSRAIHENAAYVIPKITAAVEEAKLAGGGVFKGDRLLGWLGEQETIAYRWSIGDVKGGAVAFQSPAAQDGNFMDVYRPVTTTASVKPLLQDGEISILVRIKSEGDLAEEQANVDVLEPENLKKIQAAAEKTVEREVKLLISKFQKEFKVDIFGFGEAVNRRYPQVWKQIEDKWEEEIFPGIEVVVEPEIDIRRVGIKR